MSQTLLQEAAIHEAGHIVMAHHFDLTVNFTLIDKAIPGEGKTSIHWVQNQQTINALIKKDAVIEREALRNVDKE